MSVIKAGTTLTTAYTVEADTTGALEFKTGPSATLAMSISSSGVVTFPAGAGFDLSSANITNLTATSLSVSAATYLATASGSVGIGTSSPSSKLDVSVAANTDAITVSNALGRNLIIGSASDGTFDDATAVFNKNSSVGRFLFKNSGGDRMLLDSAGNLGLGVTPSAWDSVFKAIDFSTTASLAGSSGGANLFNNVYWNGSNYIYKTNLSAARYLQSGNEHYWYSATSGTAGNSVSFTQALSVGLGTSLALQGATSQTGTGITFPATQSASSNANTLDDYEEGTWTPTIVGATNPVYGASTAQGKYTVIGRMVYVEFLIVITSVTSQGTGNIQISGLPFSSASGSYDANISFIYNDTWDVNVRNAYTVGTVIQLVPNSVTQANLQWSGATLSTGYFSGSGWYIL